MKTRRVQVKKGKSRRFRMKRGGEINKKDPNMPIIASQMGGVAPAPAPAPAAAAAAAAAGVTMVTATGTTATTLTTNIKASLEAFGNALSALNTAVNNATGPLATSKFHMTEATTNAANAINLQKISEAAYTAFRTGKSGVGNGKGVYDNVLSGVTAGSPAVQVAYVADTTVTATPVADLAGAYATAKSLWVAAGNQDTTFPAIGVWAGNEGITISP